MSLRLPSSSNLESFLLGLVDYGVWEASEVGDVLLAREQFWSQLGTISDSFEGWGATTVDGTLYLTADLSDALSWLTANNPDKRPGFFTWVFPKT